MKKVLTGLMVVALLGAVAAGQIVQGYDPDFGDFLRLQDGDELQFGAGGPFTMLHEAADANANYLCIDLPAGGAVDVPVLGVGIGLDGVDLGLFDGETFPGIFLMDADRDSYVAITWASDDNPEIEVGGGATGITIPGITGYVLGDNTDLAIGTGSPSSIEYTTADANANCIILDLPTGGATDVPVFLLTQADADFGYFNGFTQTTIAIEDTDGDSWGGLTFTADDTFVIDTNAASGVGFIDDVDFGVSGTGVDVTFFGDTANYLVWWDQNGDTNGVWYFGADDYGVDVEFYGHTANYNVTWDASADSWLFGADDLGVDVVFYGAGTGNYARWDESIDSLSFVDYNVKLDDDAILYIGTGTNVTTADGDFTIDSVSDTRMDITATAANSGVWIGNGTIATDFWIDNAGTAGNDIGFDASGDSGNGIFYFGAADGDGVDVYLRGATAGAEIVWDASADELEVDATIDIDNQLGLKMTSTSSTWDPSSIADGAEEAHDVTVSGAALGDFVLVSFSLDVTDLVLDAQVTAADTVTCVLANNTGGAVDLASGTVRVVVIQND